MAARVPSARASLVISGARSSFHDRSKEAKRGRHRQASGCRIRTRMLEHVREDGEARAPASRIPQTPTYTIHKHKGWETKVRVGTTGGNGQGSCVGRRRATLWALDNGAPAWASVWRFSPALASTARKVSVSHSRLGLRRLSRRRRREAKGVETALHLDAVLER